MIDDWNDLKVFLTLAEEGQLTAAAKRLHVSHPTIARRIKALETSIGARLFDRLPDRFVLTPAGEELLADTRKMQQAAESIDRRSAGLIDMAQGVVRLSAGEAMTGFIAAHLPRLRQDLQCVEFELSASHTLANLSRREADLLIREQVPDLASIVTRKLGRAAYAIYAQAGSRIRDRSPAALRRLTWLGFDDDHAYMPGQSWTRELLAGKRPAIRVNDWLVMRDAIGAGAGLAVLPCYLADTDHRLQRIGNILPDIVADQWLLVHRDLRTLPRIRAVMDQLVALFQEQKPALAGRTATSDRRTA
ncbi:MAG: LysR family transcriptional regulator [Rhodospirillaceae bacterium]|nr:LysR family transcriptional regulator [Rhodospirillaceae bacterium]